MTKPTNATWIEVDLNAIKNNIQLISKSTKSAVMAVVKANGYGHGIVEVAKASESAGVAWLLDLYGFKVYTLVGGYKNFRNYVLDTFRLPFQFNILTGREV